MRTEAHRGASMLALNAASSLAGAEVSEARFDRVDPMKRAVAVRAWRAPPRRELHALDTAGFEHATRSAASAITQGRDRHMTKKNTITTAPINASPAAPGEWMRLAQAAKVLDMDVRTLRRAIRRNLREAEGGTITCPDGIAARKIGRHWRVQLAAAWRPAGTPGSSSPSTPP
jgi:hypothetical protein